MSSDEDDYMSDKFLQGSSKENDIRPGLVVRKKDQRIFEQHKKKLQNVQPNRAVKEQTQLEEGLKTAIGDQNKGFQMLAKMGYKPGTSLGKSNDGIIEPINVIVKKDSAGLGGGKKQRQIANKRKNEEELKNIENNFKKALHDKTKSRVLRKYFGKAQVSCEFLDKQVGLEQPLKIYHWPEPPKPKKDGDGSETDDEEEEIDYEAFITQENLDDIIDYLRRKYFYCIYCASKGTDEQDLESFCPGSMEDHDLD